MKKTLSLILTALISLTALCACTTDTPDTDASIDAPSTAISYDDVSYFIPGGDNSSAEESESSEPSDTPAESSTDDSKLEETSKPSETSQPPVQLSGKFEVKVAKYDYNNYMERQFGDECPGGPFSDVSIAILNVHNGTDKHYSVTIHGKYLDKDGNVLKTETQEWDQFASGWQKYFLFRPHMLFDKFEYTIETKEFKGDCWKTGISQTFLKMKKDNRLAYPGTATALKWVENLCGVIHYEFNVPKQFSHGLEYLVLFDEKGQVIGIYQSGREDFVPHKKLDPVGETEWYGIYYANPDEGGKIDEWPEMFRGNVTGIIVTTWIDEAGKLDEHMKNGE